MTEAEFMAAILASPEEDGPRLIFADWLDDRGGADRAEFIRVQCELMATGFGDPGPELWRRTDRAGDLARRQRQLWAMPEAGEWFGDTCFIALCRSVFDRVGELGQKPAGLIRRGFIAEVRCPLAAWLGGPCGCRGTPTLVGHQATPVPGNTGEWNVRTEFISPPGPRASCLTCAGTGTTPGIAAAVAASQPVARVVATDREPQPSNGEGPFLWYHGGHNPHYERHYLPEDMWQVVRSDPRCIQTGVWADFPDSDAAHAALSDALVAMGKRRAASQAKEPYIVAAR